MTCSQAAMLWAQDHRPETSFERKCAFANSVEYLVTGESRGTYGGPSLREHLCAWSLAGVNGVVGSADVGGTAMTAIYTDGSLPRAGGWDFFNAIEHCAKLCFSPASEHLNQLISIQEREHCFDNDPVDVEALKKVV